MRLPEDILRDTEDYIKSSKVAPLFRNMALQTFKARPEQPIRFMIEYLLKLDPNAADDILLAKQNAPRPKPDAQQSVVSVSHPDLVCSEYLTHKAPPPAEK